MNKLLRTLFISALPLLAVGCGDDDDELQAEQAARFTTSTKPAPNPVRVSLQDAIRQDAHLSAGIPGAPKFELYSEYKGEDIRQVTGVSGRKLILVFTADWCKHSKAMRECLRKLAEDEKGNFQVVDVNADKYPQLANDFNLVKVPTIRLYTEGIEVRTFEGYYDETTLRTMLNQVFSIGN
ncbi:MAG: thioredoxin family protein [Akkermansia sp.]|nr:thioredoxin family protein [Akkermansia sp.]